MKGGTRIIIVYDIQPCNNVVVALSVIIVVRFRLTCSDEISKDRLRLHLQKLILMAVNVNLILWRVSLNVSFPKMEWDYVPLEK